MSFRSLTLPFFLPDHDASRSGRILVPRPSNPYQHGIYQAPIPRPPTSVLDAEGLEETENWASKICKKHYRNISPRVYNFVQNIRDKCRTASKKTTSKSKRQELQQTIRIERDMFSSRWDTVHGIGGLCATLCQCMNAIMEMRLEIEYGDYLAESLKGLKKDQFDEAIRGKALFWRANGDWQSIAEILDDELQAISRRQNSIRLGFLDDPIPATPCLDDIRHAATKLGIDAAQILFEIRSYAARNATCHTGIKGMIQGCQWQKLAEQICNDKKWLSKIFEGRTEAQVRMRITIGKIESMWFDECWMDEDGQVICRISEAAVMASKRRHSRGLKDNSLAE